MRLFATLFLLTAWPVAVCADDPAIRVPVVPVPNPPAPAPGAASKLTLDTLLVIDSDVPVILLVSPEGLVKVTEDVGPVKIRGKFVDDPLKVQTKTFKGKQVFVVEAVPGAMGHCELLVVPVGAKDPKDVIRVPVDVDGGQGPIPPPKPKPPGPNPPDPPTPVTSFRVIFIYESASTLTAAQNGVIFGKTVEDYLNVTCTGGKAGWRRRDKDAPGDADTTMAAMWAATKPKVTGTPCVAVAVNEKVEIIDIEATPAEMVATLKKYAGGK